MSAMPSAATPEELKGRIEAGIPVIDGPRFPKGASRPDSCSPGGFVQGDETEAK